MVLLVNGKPLYLTPVGKRRIELITTGELRDNTDIDILEITNTPPHLARYVLNSF